MKIEKFTLKNNLIFAPIAGFSTPPVRRLMAENGAGLTVTEMVSVKGLLFGNEKTEHLLRVSAAESVTCVQLFGREPDEFYRCAQLPALERFDIIDINMGCPVKKIVNNGEGSALIAEPQRAAAIVAAVKKAGKTVTVKTRLGINDKTGILSLAPRLRDAGVSMLTVHGRTAKEMYSGAADYDSIAAVKRLLPDLTVAVNGDILDRTGFLRAMATGADAAMIGRGALIDPGIFLELCGINRPDKKTLILRMIDYCGEFFGTRAVPELRKFLPYFLKGIRGGKELRLRMNFSESLDELRAGIESLNF